MYLTYEVFYFFFKLVIVVLIHKFEKKMNEYE